MSNRDAENTTRDNARSGEDDVSGFGLPGLAPVPVPPPEPVYEEKASDTRDLRTDPPPVPVPVPVPPRMPPGVEGEKGGPAQW